MAPREPRTKRAAANGRVAASPASAQPQAWEDAGTSAPSSSGGGAAHSLNRKAPSAKNEGLLELAREWIAKHQIGLSVNLLALLAAAHLFFPRARQYTTKFFRLSYYDAQVGDYMRGPDDFYYILFWMVIFTGLRDATLNYVLLPTAKALGIHKHKKQVRFAEQGWLCLYYIVLWSWGMYIFMNTKYWWNFRELWTDFPVRHLDTQFKHYYLIQFGFWIQQIVVVNIEERRKDYWQMFAHHIVTCLLLLCSYGYYETRAGNVILCIMDLVDITLPVAKLLKYAGYQVACDIAFGIFIVSWFLSRHVVYMALVWSIWVHVPQVMEQACFSSITGEQLSPLEQALVPESKRSGVLANMMQSFVEPGAPVCFNNGVRNSFLTLLLALQGLTVMWFVLILKVAYRVLSGKGADDDRSDDEGEAEEEAEEEDLAELDEKLKGRAPSSSSNSSPAPLEQEVGVEGLNLKATTRHRKNAARGANGLSLTGHSDKKELLGRIGCDKPTS